MNDHHPMLDYLREQFLASSPAPTTACGNTITGNYEGYTDEAGHRVAFAHTRIVAAANAALAKVHAMHEPNVDDFTPYCPVCHVPAPCPTRQETTRAMETRP